MSTTARQVTERPSTRITTTRTPVSIPVVPALNHEPMGSFGMGLLIARERIAEWFGGHRVESRDEPHVIPAIQWLERAQDVTRTGGIARGYSLSAHPEFGSAGWEPEYPETTGYIIPTLYTASHLFRRPDLAERATQAALREIEIQLPNGAVRGGTVVHPPAPVVFNTGQVLFGWLAALAETGRTEFELAAYQAAKYLAEELDCDGIWRHGRSPYAQKHATLYNARTAWALAEAGKRLEVPAFVDAAAKALNAVVNRQHGNGWLPACCLNDPQRPLLHTIAYAIRGLVEGGRVLDNAKMVQAGATAAERLANLVPADGRLAGRFDAQWRPAVRWCCLTGNAQMANNWLRLSIITGDSKWRLPVSSVLPFLKSTQNRTTMDPGLHGGIKGANPLTGGYGRMEVLSWATKFFVDALMRRMMRERSVVPPDSATLS
jgi:hypothetical protein